MIVDDAIRATFDKLQEDKLQELAKETVNCIVKEMEKISKEFVEYFKIKEKKDKEKFFPSDQLAYFVMRTQNFDNRPLMFWSGFV